MSAKNQKSLIVVGGVVAALLAATVLLGGYARLAPASVESNATAGTCTGCPMVPGIACATAVADETEQTCPKAQAEPCCAQDPPQDCCGQPCPKDCPKPCCAEKQDTGCCPVTADAEAK